MIELVVLSLLLLSGFWLVGALLVAVFKLTFWLVGGIFWLFGFMLLGLLGLILLPVLGLVMLPLAMPLLAFGFVLWLLLRRSPLPRTNATMWGAARS